MILKCTLFRFMVEFCIHLSLKCWKHRSMCSRFIMYFNKWCSICSDSFRMENIQLGDTSLQLPSFIKTIYQDGDSVARWLTAFRGYICDFLRKCLIVYLVKKSLIPLLMCLFLHIFHYIFPIAYIHPCFTITHII